MNIIKVIFLLKIKFFSRIIIRYKELLKIQTLSIKQLEILNFEKRKAIVTYAYHNIPFYKEYYDNNSFNPAYLITENDWHKVPFVTKALLKENGNKIINPYFSKSKLKSSTTGGSTGTPLKVYFDKNIPLEAFGWRTMSWWGISPWENQAYVYRNVRKGIGQILNTLMWWPTKRTLLDCSSMSSSNIEKFIEDINRIKPSFIQGYVGGIYDFSKFVNDNKIKIHKPKAVWVTAAPLPDSTRNFIESSLKAPVYDQYGCSEMFWLAAECKMRSGLHVLSDIRHIEFVDLEGNIVNTGQEGDVVITDLENKAFPIIRYKNGDSGKYFKNQVCSCGLPFPLIDKIKGRVTDNIKTPSGISINGSYLTTIFDDLTELVEGFQIIQHKDYSISLNCILSKGKSSDNIGFNKILNELREKSNNEINITLNFQDSLIQDRGKLKFVISEL